MKCLVSILVFFIFSGLAPAGTAAEIDDLILMTEEFPPYNFNVDGRAVGSSVDLMVMILDRMKAKQTRADIRILPWARSYRMLLEQKNTVLFAMTRTAERESLFKWVGPISTAENVLIARKDSRIQIHSGTGLRHYRVGVVRYDAGALLVMEKFGIPESRLDIAPNAVMNIRKLALGRIDMFAYDKNVTAWLMREEGLDPKDFESVFLLAKGAHYFSFNRETPDTLIQAMQKTLDEIKAEGLFRKILTQYMN